MEIVGTGKRVRIYIGEKDKAEGHHDPLWETILKLLQREGFSDISVGTAPPVHSLGVRPRLPSPTRSGPAE